MASFVSGQNKFALLANAFTGAAKGAQDFAQLKLKRDQIDESKRQFDQNLEFGFKKLDEQIRSFDIGTAEKSRLEGLAIQARAKFGADANISAERRTAMTAQASVTSTAMRVNEQREERERQMRLTVMNQGMSENLVQMELLNVHEMHKEWGATEAGEGVDVDQFWAEKGAAWNKQADAKAWALAKVLSPDGTVTDDEFRIAREKVDNYTSIKGQFTDNEMKMAQARALSRGASRGMYGGSGAYTGNGAGISVNYSKSMARKDDGTGPGGITTIRVPDGDWQSSIRQQISRGDSIHSAGQLDAFNAAESRMRAAIQYRGEGNTTDELRQMDLLKTDMKMLGNFFPPKDVEEISAVINNQINYQRALKEVGWQMIDAPTSGERPPTGESVQDPDAHADRMARQTETIAQVAAARVVPTEAETQTETLAAEGEPTEVEPTEAEAQTDVLAAEAEAQTESDGFSVKVDKKGDVSITPPKGLGSFELTTEGTVEYVPAEGYGGLEVTSGGIVQFRKVGK